MILISVKCFEVDSEKFVIVDIDGCVKINWLLIGLELILWRINKLKNCFVVVGRFVGSFGCWWLYCLLWLIILKFLGR